MKIKCFFVQSLGVIFLLRLLVASPGLASQPLIQTALADPTITAGDEFLLSVLLDLDDALSSGGYIDLVYDPNVLECVKVQNFNIFGGMKSDSCAVDSGILRMTSRTASLFHVRTFLLLETYAIVTFRAKQVAASTAIEFADTSQIFGVGGGNILVERDDSATLHITTVEPSEPASFLLWSR
ncbi:hypothetical protein U27_03017 [Candidatus Vecturithrix granuli]|uniref:Cohesin domain-containing protein n=1 Tax=Vecturithrix granuli TaxID=1499967 RepID=A0A081BUQ0_VECG1|nr:hypothetical protein U27_03017 [Candidatus Vecturithrix granuli]